MAKNDYLPSNVLAFQNLVHIIYAYATANCARWNVPIAAVAALDPLIAAFDAAVAVSENPDTRTSAAIKKRDEARAALEAVLRPFIQGHLEHNPSVTGDDLIAMGLPVHDKKPTPSPDPTGEPELTFSLPAPAVMEFHFRNKDETGHAKGKGIHGLEFRWVIADAAPVDWSELTHSEFATHTPLRLSFTGYDRGKTIYFAGRWENNAGSKGPWTEIQNAIIP
ncbi:MAG: hypothetical protein LBD87_05360 [Prevotellaceae bacterium]|jgi:hypothetical protein|nr:hypothetical protein [Prevotellaceae bacterium]